jgi:hypothetical protein
MCNNDDTNNSSGVYEMIGRNERCPICGELLWIEWGYWSYEEMLLWDYYIYPIYTFKVSHYRDVE